MSPAELYELLEAVVVNETTEVTLEAVQRLYFNVVVVHCIENISETPHKGDVAEYIAKNLIHYLKEGYEHDLNNSNAKH